MYVIIHIYYFVMLLINLKLCIMRFLGEVIPLILLMLPFKNILDRGRHFGPPFRVFLNNSTRRKHRKVIKI